jgi:hypothetical protein
VTPNMIRLAERVLHGTFRRIDDDGTFVFEMEWKYEVAYTLAQLEEALTGVHGNN